jgi:hypothetical protein
LSGRRLVAGQIVSERHEVEGRMVGLVLWGVRLLLVVMVLRILTSLFFKKGQAFPRKPQEKIKRFKSDNGTVADADFKEL